MNATQLVFKRRVVLAKPLKGDGTATLDLFEKAQVVFKSFFGGSAWWRRIGDWRIVGFEHASAHGVIFFCEQELRLTNRRKGSTILATNCESAGTISAFVATVAKMLGVTRKTPIGEVLGPRVP